MKNILIFILTASILFAGGCADKSKSDKPASTQTQEQNKNKTNKDDLAQNGYEADFYKAMQSDIRPLAVMIDNDNDKARPQIGLESAYMVYEVIVEGGATRFMALFKDDVNIGKIGPIRSSRHYFLDFALEHDAIYCHAGWSPKAQRDIRLLGVSNINGVLGDGDIFYRDKTYDSTWHNLYSEVDTFYKHASKNKGYKTTTKVKHTPYNTSSKTPKSQVEAQDISLTYSTMYKVSYKYDSKTKVYERYINGKKHTSQTGETLTAKNIIVLPLVNYDLPDGENKGRQEVITVGSGTARYITMGKVVNINWSKASRDAKTVYTDSNGNEIHLNPGNTYVQIVPSNAPVEIK